MDNNINQQIDGVVTLYCYQALIHDVEHNPSKPKKVIDYRHFTLMPKDEGLIPAHTMSVGGMTRVGQTLNWNFKLHKPGKYKDAVVSFMGSIEESGKVSVTVPGLSIEHNLDSQDCAQTHAWRFILKTLVRY
ncbi:hypothetical protein LMH66_04005 [Shewanella sp. 10N.7]|uniref:hypothetical protein n=1 Tax=Shewanella sp. 10N.7 TaxID=2885093 RepID=UPI001E440362|nr:hypothetical protein [Shewanella sp. 10N.7]MCC4831791.1 hypothetical protein [Shewanella sp. 10N.7]